jgi:hypothetical protein
VAILKMATARKFFNAAQIQHCLISTTFHMWVDYVVRIYPDIEKFLAVVIFKMAATIPHKFNIV